MKKRYMLTLTKENVEQINAHFQVLRLPPGTMSNLVDDWLINFEPTLRKMADRKRLGQQITFQELMGELLTEMGEAMKEK